MEMYTTEDLQREATELEDFGHRCGNPFGRLRPLMYHKQWRLRNVNPSFVWSCAANDAVRTEKKVKSAPHYIAALREFAEAAAIKAADLGAEPGPVCKDCGLADSHVRSCEDPHGWNEFDSPDPDRPLVLLCPACLLDREWDN